MRIFITGGTGFIGRHLIKKFEDSKHQVLILSRKTNRDYKNINFLKGNLSDISKVEKPLREFKPEVVIHLAWEGIPDYGPANSLKNLNQGIELFKLLAEIGCKKVLACGSLWEYGNSTGKVSEKTPITPLNSFTTIKNSLNILGREIFREIGIEFLWLRIFFVYGPGQKSISLIPYLIASGKSGEVAEIRNPNAKNDFVFVDDVADAILSLIENNAPEGEYNIGSGKLSALKDIVEIINSNFNIKSRFQKAEMKQMDKISALTADISKLKKATSWRPKTSLKSGVQKTIESFSIKD